MGDTSRSRSALALFREPEFVALSSTRFVRGMSFATIIIALALYADKYAASGVVAGLFGTTYAVARLALGLPIGRAIDIGDGKRYLLGGLAVNVLIMVGYMQVGSIEHVLLFRTVQGAGSVLLVVSSTTIISQVAPEDERGHWIGVSGQVKAASSLTGDMVGGALLFAYGFVTTYAVLIGVTAVAALLVLLFVRPDPGTRADPGERTGVETYRRLLARRGVQALVTFRLVFSFAKMAVVIFLPIFARTEFGMTSVAIGGIIAGGRVTRTLTQGYFGALGDRFGRLPWFIVVSTVVYAAGTAAIPFALDAATVTAPVSLSAFGRSLALSPAWLWLFGCYVLLGLADSLRVPSSYAMFVAESEAYDAVAGSISLRSVSWQVGAAIGPFVVGAVLDYWSFYAAFWLAAGGAVLSGVAFGLIVPSLALVDRFRGVERGG